MGAAVQGALLTNSIKEAVLNDVTPHSLGVETQDGAFIPIIKRNTAVPVSASRLFTTVSDTQKAVDIKVLQGESKKAEDNTVLGTFSLQGIKKTKKGIPHIEVRFSLDEDGILNVSARDKASGVLHKITLCRKKADTKASGKISFLEAEVRDNIFVLEKYLARADVYKTADLKTEISSVLIKAKSALKKSAVSELSEYNEIMKVLKEELLIILKEKEAKYESA
jgi:molecular chaperone DnaK